MEANFLNRSGASGFCLNIFLLVNYIKFSLHMFNIINFLWFLFKFIFIDEISLYMKQLSIFLPIAHGPNSMLEIVLMWNN